MRYKIFISSVQKEFANERQMLSDYLQKDAIDAFINQVSENIIYNRFTTGYEL